MWIGWGFRISMPPLPIRPGALAMPPRPTTRTEKALKLQNDLLKRRPNDPGRTKELDRIKEGLENSSPKQ